VRSYGLHPFAEVRREELPFALAMALYSFLVIASFWILKPLKKSLLVGFYDQSGFDFLGLQLGAAQAELLAKVLNMVVAMAAVAVFSLAASRLRRERLSLLFTGAFLVGYLAFAAVSTRPGPAVVWSFYLFGDLFATLMVAAFFAFLNDSVSAGAARRLYGLVGLGGVLGGVVGSTVLSAWIDEVGVATWLWICFGLGLGIGVVVILAARMASRLAPDARPEARAREPESGSGWQRTLAGARLTLRSRYLLAIAAIVGSYEIVSTVMDFQFTSTVAHYLDGDAIGAQFARVFAITNAVSVVVQLFVTPLLLTRFGVGAALLVLPAAVLAGSTAFLLVPSLWVGSLLNTADNGLAYSVQQSAREALYVPASPDEKYYAKAFIDMFVQRFAKALAVAVSLAITAWFTDFATVSWLSLATIALVALWISAARHAGRRFRAREQTARPAPQGTSTTRPKAARLSP
jgi:AAA family ATP:ADP antiporter